MSILKIAVRYLYIFCSISFSILLQDYYAYAKSDNDLEYKSLHITGCYSDMYFHEESGDILGNEIFIINSKKGYYVLYQESEGWPTVLYLLPLNVKNDRIQFTMPSKYQYMGKFDGKISDLRLEGSFKKIDYHFILKKNQSYWFAPFQKRTGYFTNVHYDKNHKKTGYRIFILYSDKKFYALYQEVHGEPETPLLLPVTFTDNQITFMLPKDKGPQIEFSGTISKTSIDGKFSNSKENIILKKSPCDWQ